MSGTTDIPRHPSKHPTACLLPLTRTCLSSLPLVLPEMFGQPVQCKSALETATRTVTSDVHLVDLLRHVLVIVLLVLLPLLALLPYHLRNMALRL